MLDTFLFNWTKTPIVRQIFATMSCFLAVMASATSYYWMSPYTTWLLSSNSDMNITITDFAWLISIIEIGAAIGCIPSAYLADRWGRKSLILSSGGIFFLIWTLNAFGNDLIILYSMRILQGISLAITDCIASVYVAEISSPKRRGILIGYYTVLWNLGVLYNYSLGSYLSFQNYTLALMAIPLLFCVTFVMMPESPYYYFMVQKKDKAKAALAWLRYGEDIEEECKQIENNVAEDMKNTADWFELISTKANRRALFIVQMVCISRYMIGIITFTVYAEDALSKIGTTHFTPNEITMFMSGISSLSAFIASFFTDSAGRKKMLLFSLIGCVITNVCVGVYYYLLEHTDVDVKPYVWILYINLTGFCIFTNAGLVQLMPTIKSEYFPTHIRSKGSSLTSLTAALSIFVQLRLYTAINEYFGMYANFIIFILFALLSIYLVIFYLTESAGKTFAEINNDIKKVVES